MSTLAERSPVRRRARAKARTTDRRRSWVLAGGVVWIVALGVLLAGVVAVNVSVLRLNVQLDQVGRERSELRSDISRLRSEISTASATSRIDRLAQKELGLVRQDFDAMIFVRLPR